MKDQFVLAESGEFVSKLIGNALGIWRLFMVPEITRLKDDDFLAKFERTFAPYLESGPTSNSQRAILQRLIEKDLNGRSQLIEPIKERIFGKPRGKWTHRDGEYYKAVVRE